MVGCNRRQARNQGGAGGRSPPRKFSPHLEKCVGHSLKILDIVQKIWAPLGKLFAPPGVPSWLRTWSQTLWPNDQTTVTPTSAEVGNSHIKTCQKSVLCHCFHQRHALSSDGSRGGQFGATSPQTSVAPPWMSPICHKCSPFWCQWK